MLRHQLAVSGTALLWLQSYLSCRSFSVKVCSHSTQPLPLSCGVPRGSAMGPPVFYLYTIPLSHLIESSSVDHHLYADYTQLFISFLRPLFPPQSRNFSLWLTKSLNGRLNPSKTEFIIIGLSIQIQKIPDPSITPITHLPLHCPCPQSWY